MEVGIEGRQRHDDLRGPGGRDVRGAELHEGSRRAREQVGDGREQDALVEPVGEDEPIRIDVEEGRGLDDRGREIGVERETLRRERAHGLHYVRRAATRVLVEVEPQPGPEVRNALNGHERVLLGGLEVLGARLPTRTSIDRAWPSRPSARASAVMVPASRRRPCFESRWTETSLTKSAAFSPPR